VKSLRPWRLGAWCLALLPGLIAGCGRTNPPAADPQPFKTAIAEYLERNNMAMAVKEVKEGPTIEGDTARLRASLTHATMGGPSVTWEFRFQKGPDGKWKAVEHKP
jgi:hypothetical protein